jgi:hypothetical protein
MIIHYVVKPAEEGSRVLKSGVILNAAIINLFIHINTIVKLFFLNTLYILYSHLHSPPPFPKSNFCKFFLTLFLLAIRITQIL